MIELNGVSCRVVVRESRGMPDAGNLSLNGVYEYAEDNGVGNRVAYYEASAPDNGTPANTPAKPNLTTSPSAPAAPGGRVSLTITVSGLGNRVSIVESNQQPHEGEYRVSGMGEDVQFRLSPNTNVHLVISGLQNQVSIPNALRQRVKISETGLENQVLYR